MNIGDAGTAWSGGDNWADVRVAEIIRAWVWNGGGLIGIGEPTAYEKDGELFVLSDVLGVQKEIGFTASNNKPAIEADRNHFITAELNEEVDYGEGMTMIYRSEDSAQILDIQNRSCNMAVNVFGGGRSVYFAGMPYNATNARLLYRAVFWAAGREDAMNAFYSDNKNVECNAYPEAGRFCVMNNATDKQKATIRVNGNEIKVVLKPMECKWMDI